MTSGGGTEPFPCETVVLELVLSQYIYVPALVLCNNITKAHFHLGLSQSLATLGKLTRLPLYLQRTF
jgi:hypothetical protein